MFSKYSIILVIITEYSIFHNVITTMAASSTTKHLRRHQHQERQTIMTTKCQDETKDFIFETDLFRLFGDFYDKEFNACVFKKDSACKIDFNIVFASRYPTAAAECAIQGNGRFLTYTVVLDSCKQNNINGIYDEAPDQIEIIGFPHCVPSSCTTNDFEQFHESFPGAFYCQNTYSDVKQGLSICPDKKGDVSVGDSLKTVMTCKKVAVNVGRWCTYPNVQSHCATTCKTCAAIGEKFCGDYREKFNVGNIKDDEMSYMKKCWQVSLDKSKWCAYENAQDLCRKTCGLC